MNKFLKSIMFAFVFLFTATVFVACGGDNRTLNIDIEKAYTSAGYSAEETTADYSGINFVAAHLVEKGDGVNAVSAKLYMFSTQGDAQIFAEMMIGEEGFISFRSRNVVLTQMYVGGVKATSLDATPVVELQTILSNAWTYS